LATIILNNGMINAINAASEDLEVSNGPGDSSTIANVMTGTDIGVNDDDFSIVLLQDSVLLFSGGVAEGDVSVEGNSVAFLLGTATVGGNLTLADDSELQFSDMALVEGDIELDDNAMADFSGGTVEGEVVVAGDATAIFTGGTFEDTIVGEDNAVIHFVMGTAEDNVEAADDAVIHISGGEVQGSVESVDDATVSITGGAFPAIFSDGEDLLAEGGTLHVTGGLIGEAGEDGGGSVIATINGRVTFTGVEIAGVADGTAPTASFSSRANSVLDLSNVAVGDLSLNATTSGTLNVDNVTADEVTASMLGGGTINLNSGEAASLDVVSEVGSNLNLRVGDFGDMTVALKSMSVLRVFGDSFTFLGIPVESLPAEGYDPLTGELFAIGGTLAGVLADGTSFSMTFSRQFSPPDQAAHIFLVPELSTAVLGFLALASFLAGRPRRNRRA
jgi:hypothetical protein